ncbi:MAG: tetratricopeptide repeat protein [Firmicutes bacterium]|nr:tetratricopeptide repeat protein [Bacillota bacterium]
MTKGPVEEPARSEARGDGGHPADALVAMDAGLENLAEDPRVARGNAEERVRKGCELLGKGRLDDAQAEFEAAVALDPENAQAHNKLGVVLAHKGKLDEARMRFEKALALDPRCAAAMSNLGNIYKEKNMLDRAVEFYKMALSVDPDHATAHHNLGVVYRQMGMIDRAVSHFKQAHRLELRALSSESRAAARAGRYLWPLIAVALIVAYVLAFGK